MIETETGFFPVAPVGPAIRKWHSAMEADCPVDIEEWTKLTCTSDDPEERMAELRPKLYIAGGMIAPLVTRDFINLKSERLPQGIVRGPIYEDYKYAENDRRVQAPERPVTTFKDLHQQLKHTALYTMNQFMVPEEYGPAAYALNKLVRLANKIEPQERYTSAKRFVRAGLNTGIEMGIGALSGISSMTRLERTSTDKEEFSAIAHNSRSLLGAVAALNIVQIDPFRRAMISRPTTDKDAPNADLTPYFNANLLTFTGDPNAADAAVNYIKPVDQFIDPASGTRIGDMKLPYPTLACLALPRVGEKGSAIYELWNYLSCITANMLYPSE